MIRQIIVQEEEEKLGIHVFVKKYRLVWKKTVLFITHNLANVKQCDTILFLVQGKLFAQGNHKWLIDNCAKYKQLYENQAARFLEKG